MDGRLRRAGRWLVRGTNLRVVVAGLIALALLGYVIDIASHGDLAADLGDVLRGVGPIAIALAVPYFALRALTWHLLLVQVGVSAPMRQTLAAFSTGELTKSIPGGVYLETYVLARLEHLGERQIVDAAVATTGMDVMIGTVAFLTAMAIGLPDNPWFRWLLVGVAAAWIVFFGMVVVVIRWWRPQERPSARPGARAVGRILAEAAQGAGRLVRPAPVRPLAATAAYLLIYAVLLQLVLASLGLDRVGFVAAVSVVAITSLANDLLPIPTELGLTEITGVGVLDAYGLAAPEAAIVMLGYRAVTSGALIVLVAAVLGYLRGTLRSPVLRIPDPPR